MQVFLKHMRILVIKPSSLGDIVHGLEVVGILKRHFPEMKIDWVVRDCWSGIVEASQLVDRIFLFHRHGGIRKFCRLISDIRSYKYDAVLDMQGLARTGVLTFFARSPRKIGRYDSREGAYLAYNELTDQGGFHAVDKLLQFLPKFGLSPIFEHCLEFSLPKLSVLKFSKDLPSNYIHNYILVFPESRRAEKQWPYFSELSENLAKKHPYLGIVVVGQSRESADFWKKNTLKNILNLAGCTDLIDMLVLVQNCSLLIANDSAPIHIGAAMNRPVIALFGPTDPAKFGPYPLDESDHTVLFRPNLAELTVGEVEKVVVDNIDKFLHDH